MTCKNPHCESPGPFGRHGVEAYCAACNKAGVPELIARVEAAESVIAKLVEAAKMALARIKSDIESYPNYLIPEGNALRAAIAEAKRLGTVKKPEGRE